MDKPTTSGYRSNAINAVANFAAAVQPIAGAGICIAPGANGSVVSMASPDVGPRTFGSISIEAIPNANVGVLPRLVLRTISIYGELGDDSLSLPAEITAIDDLVRVLYVDVTRTRSFYTQYPLYTYTIDLGDSSYPAMGELGVAWLEKNDGTGPQNTSAYFVFVVCPNRNTYQEYGTGFIPHLQWIGHYDLASGVTFRADTIMPTFDVDKLSLAPLANGRREISGWSDKEATLPTWGPHPDKEQYLYRDADTGETGYRSLSGLIYKLKQEFDMRYVRRSE